MSSAVPMAPTRTPVHTYRLQLGPDLTFTQAAQKVPYLHALGVTDLYLSPILAAAPGSKHGYDVVDHSRISAVLGGRAGFEHLADRKSTRLNSSHVAISYAVFCLKKKTTAPPTHRATH